LPVNAAFSLIMPLIENHKKHFNNISGQNIFYSLINVVYFDTYLYIYTYTIIFKPVVTINPTLLYTVNTVTPLQQ